MTDYISKLILRSKNMCFWKLKKHLESYKIYLDKATLLKRLKNLNFKSKTE